MKRVNGAGASLGVQAAVSGIAGALTALSGAFLSGAALALAHTGGQWVLWPICALCTAWRAATRGLPAILCWPIPPLLCAGVYWAIVGLPPSAGAALLTTFVGILGGSAGEVWRGRHKSDGR